MCCYNKAGRCCCACSCCDGYIDKEDEQMIICKLTIFLVAVQHKNMFYDYENFPWTVL